MTLKEFATMGGEARAKKLSKARRVEIARNAGLASAKVKRACKNRANSTVNGKITKNKV